MKCETEGTVRILYIYGMHQVPIVASPVTFPRFIPLNLTQFTQFTLILVGKIYELDKLPCNLFFPAQNVTYHIAHLTQIDMVPPEVTGSAPFSVNGTLSALKKKRHTFGKGLSFF